MNKHVCVDKPNVSKKSQSQQSCWVLNRFWDTTFYLAIILLFSIAFASPPMLAEEQANESGMADESSVLSDNESQQDALDATTANTAAEPNDSNVPNDSNETYSMAMENLQVEGNISNMTSLVCSQTVCSQGCVVCSDNQCHGQGFVCSELLDIEKVFPDNISIGLVQVNILLRNSGNVDLRNISVSLGGDGLYTIKKTPIDYLIAGDKDYAFVNVNATKAGAIDLVIKLHINGLLKDTFVRQLNVFKEEEPVSKETAYNATEINATEIINGFDKLKERYIEVEQEYQNKKLQGYYVDLIYDNLKGLKNYIKDSQFYLEYGDYKKVKVDLKVINGILNDIEQELKNAKKEETTFMDKIKRNMLYIGSIAAAIVSVFTAYGLLRSNINKQRIAELQQKLTFVEKKQDNKKTDDDNKNKQDGNACKKDDNGDK